MLCRVKMHKAMMILMPTRMCSIDKDVKGQGGALNDLYKRTIPIHRKGSRFAGS